MPSVYEVARKYDAFLIEDACHGLGEMCPRSDSEPKKIAIVTLMLLHFISSREEYDDW